MPDSRYFYICGERLIDFEIGWDEESRRLFFNAIPVPTDDEVQRRRLKEPDYVAF